MSRALPAIASPDRAWRRLVGGRPNIDRLGDGTLLPSRRLFDLGRNGERLREVTRRLEVHETAHHVVHRARHAVDVGAALEPQVHTGLDRHIHAGLQLQLTLHIAHIVAAHFAIGAGPDELYELLTRQLDPALRLQGQVTFRMQHDERRAVGIIAHVQQAGALGGPDFDDLFTLILEQLDRIAGRRDNALVSVLRRVVLAVPHRANDVGPLGVTGLERDEHLVPDLGHEHDPAAVAGIGRHEPRPAAPLVGALPPVADPDAAAALRIGVVHDHGRNHTQSVAAARALRIRVAAPRSGGERVAVHLTAEAVGNGDESDAPDDGQREALATIADLDGVPGLQAAMSGAAAQHHGAT